jgi:hypothetical protein
VAKLVGGGVRKDVFRFNRDPGTNAFSREDAEAFFICDYDQLVHLKETKDQVVIRALTIH